MRIGNSLRTTTAAALAALWLMASPSPALEPEDGESVPTDSGVSLDKVRLGGLPFRRIADLQVGAGIISPLIAFSVGGSVEFYPLDHFGLGLNASYLSGFEVYDLVEGSEFGMDLSYRWDLAIVMHQAKGSVEQFSLGPLLGFLTLFTDRLDQFQVGPSISETEHWEQHRTYLGFDVMCSFQYTYWTRKHSGFNLQLDSGISILFPAQEPANIERIIVPTLLRLRVGIAL